MAGEHEGHRLVSDLSVTEALSILLRGEQEAEHVTRVADRPMLFDDAVHDVEQRLAEGIDAAFINTSGVRTNLDVLNARDQLVQARRDLTQARLAHLLALASEEARFSGRAIAWTAEPPGYRFWQRDRDDGWSEIRERDLLLPRTLPGNMAVLGLRVENSPVAGPLRLEFGSDGAASAFTLELGLG